MKNNGFENSNFTTPAFPHPEMTEFAGVSKFEYFYAAAITGLAGTGRLGVDDIATLGYEVAKAAEARLELADDKRTLYIQQIQSLYPLNSEFPETAQVGADLLLPILRENWKRLPLDLLEKFAEACLYKHEEE